MTQFSLASIVRMGAAAAACAALLAAATLPASAQAPAVRVGIASVTELPYPDAQLLVNLEDTTGADLSVLTPQNFIITVDGKPATIKAADLASNEKIGADVLLIMDTSGSMKGEALAQAKSAAIEFVAGLAPEDRVAVMRFANSVTVRQEFTTDRGAIYGALDGLVADGQTELYKATAAAANKVRESTSNRRIVVLLTDGAQDAIITDVTDQDALNAAIDSGAAFYTIAQGSQAAGSQYLIDLADRTRGRYLEAPAPGDLRGVYASIGRLLRSQYLITFDASAAAGKASAPLTVQLQSAGGTAVAASEFRPSAAFVAPKINVTLTGVQSGESLDEPREVTAIAATAQPVTKVAFYVDGINVYETAVAPYSFTYDPKTYGGGEHTLTASVQAGGQSGDSVPLTFTSTLPEASSGGESSGGGLPVVPIAGGVVGLVVLAGVGFVALSLARGRSAVKIAVPAEQRITPWATAHRPISTMPPPEAVEDAVAPPAEEIGEPMGLLVARDGSLLGAEYEIGGRPVSLGSARTCAVRIPDVAQEEARIWVRDGHLMLHKMTRLTLIATDGISGGWQILEPGDTFEVGSHTFEFKLLPQEIPAEDRGAVPNILRDASPPPRDPAPSAPPLRWGDAPASNVGRIWPSDTPVVPSPEPDDDAGDLEEHAS